LKWPGKIRGVKRLYVCLLKARHRLFLRGRDKRPVVESILNKDVVVLPGVMNPKLFRTGTFLAEHLTRSTVPEDALVLDMGTGSGIAALFAATWARRVIAIDINPAAVKCARINVLLHDVQHKVTVEQGDLFDTVGDKQFDLIIFNPPYLAGRAVNDFEKALFGVETIAGFAGQVGSHLTDQGNVLLVLSTLADRAQIIGFFSKAHLAAHLVAEKGYVNETLLLYRVTRSAANSISESCAPSGETVRK